MAYPKYKDIEHPLLRLIYQQGDPDYQIHASDTYAPLSKHFGLSETERLQVLDDGSKRSVWNNMVQWARNSLVKKNLILSEAQSKRAYWRLSKEGVKYTRSIMIFQPVYADEITSSIFEGAKYAVTVNAYERSMEARQACLDHYGYDCVICGFNFESVFGERGKNFIHVHHVVPLSIIGSSYKVDPITDLRPVCPNCHAIIHRTYPPCTIEDAQKLLNKP
ncbi:MAG TPA: winged helix-turn-helix domain-containing protein [Telluria sp.]